MIDLTTSFKNVIRKAVTTTTQIDGNSAYNIQLQSYNAPLQSEVVYPYGIAGSPPKGSAALLFQVAGQPQNLTAIVYDPATRFLGLAEGEFIVGNQKVQTFIKFDKDGNVQIQTNGLCKIIGDLEVTGEITADANVTVKGEVVVAGEMTVLNDTDPLAMSDFRTIYNSHTHKENDVPNNTDTPNQTI